MSILESLTESLASGLARAVACIQHAERSSTRSPNAAAVQRLDLRRPRVSGPRDWRQHCPVQRHQWAAAQETTGEGPGRAGQAALRRAEPGADRYPGVRLHGA